MPYFSHDDIAQIGTAPSKAPVGAIRISGENAFSLLLAATRGLEEILAHPVRRTVCDGEFMLSLRSMGKPSVNENTKACQTVLPCPARFFIMPAPASYTRENVAEIHLSGSGVLLRTALNTLMLAGARPAAPGEFTFRAFRNGRLNLGQAEAVEEVIRAENDWERRQALARLGDHAMTQIRSWRDAMLDIAASLEAALDFAEEELQENVIASLAAMSKQLSQAGLTLANGNSGGTGDDLPHIALVGLTNAGKSSLFNALLDEDVVLVSPEASTTRDSLRREVCWGGMSLQLSDNPGYDAASGGSGGQAAGEALQQLGSEDLACWVVDASKVLGKEEKEFVARLSGKVILVLHKCDLPAMTTVQQATELVAAHDVSVIASVEASASTRAGVPTLRALIAASAAKSERTRDRWNRRESLELHAALECCRAAEAELSGPGRLELAADDVRRGVTAFSRALGEGYAEEALGRIFSRFCIGK